MATTLIPPKPKRKTEETPRRPTLQDGGGGFGGRGSDDRGRGGDGGGPDPGRRLVQRYKLGVWVGIGGIVMVFAAFTSAMVVRRGLSDDWRSFDLPAVLWISTAILLASSFSLERAKRSMRLRVDAELRRWLGVTAGLGGAFLVAQYIGWRELASRGIYLASNPSSSFYYLLTAAHGVHLLGGVVALSYVVFRVWQRRVWATREAAIEATALYWHFMDGLWVYLVLLLAFWR